MKSKTKKRNKTQSQNNFNQLKKTDRILSIDIFRGVTILFMMYHNLIQKSDGVPDFCKHAVGYGFRWPDVIYPMFLFAIALTYSKSFNKSLENFGWWSTIGKFVKRGLILIAIGVIDTTRPNLDAGNNIFYAFGFQEILLCIGVAIILMIPIIKIRPKIRLLLSIISLILYQIVLFQNFTFKDLTYTIGEWNYQGAMGVFGGAIGSTIFLMIATSIVDINIFKEKKLWIFGVITLISGMIINFIGMSGPELLKISKIHTTSSYLLVSLGISLLIYFSINIFEKKLPYIISRFFTIFGRNSLLIYVLHWKFIVGFPNMFLGSVFALISIGFWAVICYILDENGKYLVV